MDYNGTEDKITRNTQRTSKISTMDDHENDNV